MMEEKPRIHREVRACPPTYIRKLMERGNLKVIEVAELLGLSRSAIDLALRENSIRESFDLAAKALLADLMPHFEDDLEDLLWKISCYYSTRSVLELTEEETQLLHLPLRTIIKQAGERRG